MKRKSSQAFDSANDGADSKVTTSRTLQINGIPESLGDEELEEHFGDFGPLKRCFVVRKKKTDAETAPKPPTGGSGASTFRGYVEFALPEDARGCVQKCGKQVQIQHAGKLVRLNVFPVADKNSTGFVNKKAKQESDEGGGDAVDKRDKKYFEQLRENVRFAKQRKARLIVRNLSFKAEEADVRKHFEACGKVTEIKILTKPNGLRVGCAFVQFSNVAEAAKAIKQLNRSNIRDRPVAVDWAVSKDEYRSGGAKDSEEVKPTKDQEEEREEDEIDEETNDDDGDEEDEEEVNSGDEEEEDEEESDDGEEEEDESDDNKSFDDGDDDDEKPQKKTHNLKTGHDIAENKTVFLRNLSFDSEEDDLLELMEESFGKVFFARLVLDKMTEHPKGSAFVKFRDAESVEKCLRASSEGEGIQLDGRRIYASKAMTKEDAEEAKEKKKEEAKAKKDSRNLHLAVEGLVRQGTKAAEGVSEQDMAKRISLEKWKRQMLKNLTMFISPLRLCVRNLPPNVDDQKLRRLVLKHGVESSEIRITEAKVIKDLAANKSKGYGFVSFSKHEDALAALRKLNNNPSVFGKAARPIVEFSIENRKAITARMKRLEKSKEFVAKPRGEKGGKKLNTSAQKQSAGGKLEDSEKPAFMGMSNNPTQKKMPSHLGPKIRHKERPTKISRKDIRKREQEQKNPKLKKKALAAQARERDNHGLEAAAEKKQKKQKKGKPKQVVKDIREGKKFDEIIQKYRNKLSSAPAQTLRKKWFEG